MRVLCLPLIGISNIKSDSDYLIYADLIKGAEGRGWFFYLILPEYAREQLTDVVLPNTEIIYVPMTTDFFRESMTWPDALTKIFGRREGKYMVDLFVTTRTGGSVVGQSALSDFRRHFHLPTVIIEAMVRAWQNPNIVDASLRGLSYCTAHTWLLSDEERLRALDVIRKACAPYMAQKFVENCKIIETGVRVHDLKVVADETPKNDKFTLFFGARFSKEKRPDKMVEIVEKFFSFGRDVNIVVTTQHVGSHDLQKYGKSSAFTELNVGCPRNEFLRKSAASHVFICASDDESWPSGFWEQLYIVGLGIFPDKPWVRANLPPEYPYIYKDMMEAHTMIRYMYDNYEEAKERVAWIRPWIEEHANWRSQLDKALDWFDEIEKPTQHLSMKMEGKKGPGLGVLALDTAAEFEGEFAWVDFLKALAKKTETYKPFVIARTLYPNRYEVYRHLIDHGYEDLCNDAEVILRRKQEVQNESTKS